MSRCWQLVESDAQLASVLAQHRGCPAVAVDTEFMRRNTFYPQVALLQLCFDEQAWLVDPLKLEDTAPLRTLFGDPGTVKVLHSASEDLEVFQQWLGVLPAPLFDTQRAAALVDLGFGIGYRGLVLKLRGVDLPKGETRSDWLQRPLTESQCEYAAQDVTHLLPVYQQLESLCREQGKLDWVLEDGELASAGLASTVDGYYRRIKSAWKLDNRQLAALVALSAWREAQARERDKPRGWIIDDKACLELARSNPATAADMAHLDLHPGLLRRHGDTLLALLREAAQCPEEELPERLPAPLAAAQRNALKQLKQRAQQLAGELGMAPEALLSGKDFEMLLREAAGEAVSPPAQWSGWRRQRVIEPLRGYLAGSAA